MNTFDKVAELVQGHLGVDASEVLMTSNFQNDLRADSLAIVEFVMELEEVFDVEIPDEVSADLKTVGDVVKYIEDHK